MNAPRRRWRGAIHQRHSPPAPGYYRPMLYTVGYEGIEISAFVALLEGAAVTCLVDVRELPLSRKRGFSKTPLSTVLASRGIAYVHLPDLGCPRPVRDRYRVDGDWSRYTRSFLAHLRSADAPLRELVKISRRATACLMCFEADFHRCHRAMVASAATALGAPAVRHLVPRAEASAWPEPAAA